MISVLSKRANSTVWESSLYQPKGPLEIPPKVGAHLPSKIWSFSGQPAFLKISTDLGSISDRGGETGFPPELIIRPATRSFPRYCLIPWPEEVEWSNTGSDYGLLLSLLLSCILGDWLLEVCSFHGRGKTGKEN